MRLPLRIGTRGSPLALAQANAVREALLAVRPDLPPDAVLIEPITTTGDRIRDRPLADIGGKGLFTKEIEEALREGRVAMAVHSLKDVPAFLPDGLIIGCVLEREDPRDVFLSPVAATLRDLSEDAVLGTASIRRQAQALRIRPDLRIEMLRGNVETRLRKLESGVVDATLLAAAGLRRLGLMRYTTGLMDPEDILPAVAQGAIGIEIRADDPETHDLLAPLNHEASAACVRAERAFLAVLEGSCKTPIAALAEIDEAGTLRLRTRLLAPDGRTMIEAARLGSAGDAEALGRDAGAEIRSRASPELLAGLPGVAP